MPTVTTAINNNSELKVDPESEDVGCKIKLPLQTITSVAT